jgi:hypothetical protein
MSRKVSAAGKKLIKQRRSELGWKYTDPQWAIATGKILQPDLDWDKEGTRDPYRELSSSSLRCFQAGKPIVDKNFNALCKALGLDPNLVANNTSITTNQLDDLIDMPKSEFFCGRQVELAQIGEWLNSGVPFLNIWGAAGIGKSSLLAHWLKTQSTFAKVIWRNVDGENYPQSCYEFITELLSSLSPGIELAGNQFTALNKILLTQKTLVIINGNFNDEYCQWFKNLATQRHQSCVVVISEPDLEIVVSNRNLPKKYKVEGLDLPAIKEFWLHHTGDHDLATLDISDHDFAELANRYDGNPTALESAIEMVVHDYKGNLHRAMEETAFVANHLKQILDRSFKCCPHEEKQILLVMASIEDWVGVEGIEALIQENLPKPQYINCADALRRSSIVKSKWVDDERRYAMPTMWRKYIQRYQLGK